MTEPKIDIENLALRMTERAEVLSLIPLTDERAPLEMTDTYGVMRQPRNPQRDTNTRAFIEVMREFEAAISNDYLRAAIGKRIDSLERAAERAQSGTHIEDDQPAAELIKTARFYAPMLAEVTAPPADAEERERIAAGLIKYAAAVEAGAAAYACTIFDSSKQSQAWQTAAQSLADTMFEARAFIPKWAANVGMNGNALSIEPFKRAARACRDSVSGERMLIDASKVFADKARTVAAIIV